MASSFFESDQGTVSHGHDDDESVPIVRISPLIPLNSHDSNNRGKLHEKLMVWLQLSFYVAAWYMTSLITLFMNKHILSSLQANPHTLAITQMSSTMLYGAFKVYIWPIIMGVEKNVPLLPLPLSGGRVSFAAIAERRQFYRDMILVGLMRFATVFLGLISLKYVAVSFVETVKSSAPFLTVIVSRCILNERTTMFVNLSLVPIVIGLALTSAHELSFNVIGFCAAMLNNTVDCIQNVFSKKLLTSKLSYVELQFYTSVSAVVVQIPLLMANVILNLNAHGDSSGSLSEHIMVAALPTRGLFSSLWFCLFIDGLFFHLQSLMAYAVMNLISPVTHSVVNTMKRTMLIWLSVLFFHNIITPWSGIGTVLVIGGVLLYGHARRKSDLASTL